MAINGTYSYSSGTSTSGKTDTAEMAVNYPSRVAHTCTM